MGFKLYFAGSSYREVEKEIMKSSGLRLFSYYLNKNLIEHWMENKQSIFLDSGAFSAHTKGAQIDVDEYIKYINERDEYLTVFAQLDTIPGEFGKPKTKKQLEEAPELTWENYLYMYDRVKSPEKLMPIFHQGEDFKHLWRMLEHEPRIEYIGISPANDVSTPRKATWMSECFDIIKQSSNPDVKTHAYGMTSIRLLETFPLYSADSTSWLMTAINGGVMSKYGILTVSEQLERDPKHVIYMGEEYREEIERYVGKYDLTIDELRTEYRKRMLFNMRYMAEWASNYEKKDELIVQHTLF